MMAETSNLGTLYVVATPIGNLEEISPRAINVLQNVDLIACEDTRHTKKLLNHLGISQPLTSYYREKEQQKAKILLQKLQDGKKIAIVSDAGTPGISDPSNTGQHGKKGGDSHCPHFRTISLDNSTLNSRSQGFPILFCRFPTLQKESAQNLFQTVSPPALADYFL